MKNWEEEFDKKFGDFYGTTIADKSITTLKASDVKAFIHQVQAETAKAVINDIPTECPHYTCDEIGCNNIHLKQHLTSKYTRLLKELKQ